MSATLRKSVDMDTNTASASGRPFPSQTHFLLLIALGVLFKFYGFTAPWGTKDHYNYGGIYMNMATRCMNETPFEISRGVPHTGCEKGSLDFYPNHPPTVLFALAGMTKFFGDHEWVYRLFTLIFSTLNIYLVFKIARTLWPVGDGPYWAALFQSYVLGTIYFGTHIDFIGEFTISFILLSALGALRDHWITAAALALLAGITAWPGYIMLGTLTLVSFFDFYRERKTAKMRPFLMIAACGLGFFMILATLSYLTNAPNILQFLYDRLTPKYQAAQVQTPFYFTPFLFAKNILQSLSRLLGPAFLSMVLYELIRGPSTHDNKLPVSSFYRALFLVGGTWVLFACVGYRGMMVHVFEYLFLIPALSLVFGNFAQGLWNGQIQWNSKLLIALALTACAFYPFGIFQSNRIHDIINSVGFVGLALAFAMHPPLRKPSGFLAVTVAMGLLNLSQTANYRNEASSEKAFCDQARQSFALTGQPFHTNERATMAKSFYCGATPVIYEGSDH